MPLLISRSPKTTAETDRTNDRYLSGLRARNHAILQEIYQAFFPAIRSHIQQKGGRLEDAEDAFQDSLVVLYRKLDEETFQLTSSFGTFLYAVASRIWLGRMSRKQKNPQTPLALSEPIETHDMAQALEQTEKYRLFREKLQLLGQDCQRVLQLFFAKKPMKQIAQEMGYGSEQYAKKRKFQCKQKLTELIQKDPRYQEMKR